MCSQVLTSAALLNGLEMATLVNLKMPLQEATRFSNPTFTSAENLLNRLIKSVSALANETARPYSLYLNYVPKCYFRFKLSI